MTELAVIAAQFRLMVIFLSARPGPAAAGGAGPQGPRAPQADHSSCASTKSLAVHAQRVRARSRVSPAGGAGGGAVVEINR